MPLSRLAPAILGWLFVTAAEYLLIGCGGSTSTQLPPPPNSSNSLQMVSISTAGVVGDKASSSPVVSANGRFVYFLSQADNLAPSNSFNTGIFLRDTCRGTSNCSPSTTAITLAPNVPGVTGYSFPSALSASLDGRFVVFVIASQGPIPPEAQTPRIAVVDTCAGVANCTPSQTGGVVATNFTTFLGMSTSGRFTAYVDGSAHPFETFLVDSCLGAANCVSSTKLVSVANNGTAANGDSAITSMTPDGRFVAFSSFATNLDPAGTSGASFVYVRDTCAGAASCIPTTTLVSKDSSGNAVPASAPSMSTDGRFVAFTTSSGVLVRDTCRNASSCVPSTFTQAGSTVPFNFPNPSLSAAGRFLAFEQSSNIFAVTDTCLGMANCTPVTKQMPIADNGTPLNVSANLGAISGDGKSAVFSSSAPSIDPAHLNPNGVQQAYIGPTSF